MSNNRYPNLDRMKECRERMFAVFEFIEYLMHHLPTLDEADGRRLEKLAYEMFSVDKKALEQERVQLLKDVDVIANGWKPT